MKVEPDYIHKRHEVFRAAKAEPAAAEEPAKAEGGDE
jgi:hypothetical protein